MCHSNVSYMPMWFNFSNRDTIQIATFAETNGYAIQFPGISYAYIYTVCSDRCCWFRADAYLDERKNGRHQCMESDTDLRRTDGFVFLYW